MVGVGNTVKVKGLSEKIDYGKKGEQESGIAQGRGNEIGQFEPQILALGHMIRHNRMDQERQFENNGNQEQGKNRIRIKTPEYIEHFPENTLIGAS